MTKKTFAFVACAAVAVAASAIARPPAVLEAHGSPADVAEDAVVQQGTAPVRYVTASAGNTARYRIREQLVGLDFPNDAVGETKAVTGVIAADARGNVVASESKFTIDVSGLTSDRDRRDNFVRRRVLETEQHPSVTFVPKSVRGISLPLPRSGKRSFQLVGDLTVRGVTRPTTWTVEAEFHADRVTGAAATSFGFADFQLEKPRVASVLSVDDTIKLELDFTLVPAPAP